MALSDVYNGVTNFLDMQGDGTTQGLANGMIAPALATAAKQYYDAGQYEKLGEKAANMANPFGDRSMYRSKLDQMYTDPNYMMSDPSYQWRLNQGMGNLNRMLNAQGYQGSGKANIDLLNYAQNAASQEWAAEHNRLAGLAGAQFDPANAAKYIMQGGELKMNAQNQALASLFYPALMQNAAGVINNQKTPGGGGGGGFDPSKVVKTFTGYNGENLHVTTSGDIFNDKGQHVGASDQNGNFIPDYNYNQNNGTVVGDGSHEVNVPGSDYNTNVDPTQGYDYSKYDIDLSTIDPGILDQYYIPMP